MRVVAGELARAPARRPGRHVDAADHRQGPRGDVQRARQPRRGRRGARSPTCYAGSGALGIEALSRGAEHCTFVERDRDALRALRDQPRHARPRGSRSGSSPATCSRWPRSIDADLVFADPPYEFDDWDRLLDAADGRPFVVAESGRSSSSRPDGWEQSCATRAPTARATGHVTSNATAAPDDLLRPMTEYVCAAMATVLYPGSFDPHPPRTSRRDRPGRWSCSATSSSP